MKNFNFAVIKSNNSGKSGKFNIKSEELYEIPAMANVIYLRNGYGAFGSAVLALAPNKQIYRSKRGVFVKIPLTLPAVGKPGYVSLISEKTKDGYKYEWRWHHPATKRIINL
ncbi:MAG: hypothetical protein AAB366_03090 [Patescibacteria group bacterium]